MYRGRPVLVGVNSRYLHFGQFYEKLYHFYKKRQVMSLIVCVHQELEEHDKSR